MPFSLKINRKLKIAIVTLCRLMLGIVFMMFGFFRACNPVTGALMVSEYLEAAGMDFFKPLSLLLTIGFAAAEFAIGICSLLGTNIKKTSLYTALLLLFLTPFSFYTAYFSKVEGDYQIAGLPMSDYTSCWTYLSGLLIALLLYFWRDYNKTVFTKRTQWMIGPISVVFSIILSVYCYFKLPIVDYTPFTTGTDLKAFEAAGKLTESDIEWKDDNTTFCIKEERRVPFGEKGTTSALQIYSEKKGDVSHEVIADTGYTFLLVATDLRTTSTGPRHKINDLFDYARDNGYKFYCLTTTKTSSILADEYCVESDGAEYPMLNADGRVLSKMMQSSPGLLLVKSGIIYRKWSSFELPRFEGKLEQSEEATLEEQSTNSALAKAIMHFILLISIILALDWLLGLIKWTWLKIVRSKKSRATDEANKGGKSEAEDEAEKENGKN